MKDGAEVAATFCSIRCCGGLYGIPAASVCEVLDGQIPAEVPLAPPFVRGVIAHRGDVLTVVSLRAALGCDESSVAQALLVIEEETPRERFVLALDELPGVTVVQKADYEPNPETLQARWRTMFDGAYSCGEELLIRLNLSALSPDRLCESFDSPAANRTPKDWNAHLDCG